MSTEHTTEKDRIASAIHAETCTEAVDGCDGACDRAARTLQTEYDAGYADGAAHVVAGVRAWCSLNEIAAPPLDWEGLGEFLTRVSPPATTGGRSDA